MITITQTADEFDGDAEAGPVPQLVLAFSSGGLCAARRPVTGDRIEIGRGGRPLGFGPLDDARLSRQHAQLECRGVAWWIADRGSRNGSAVNGARLTAAHALNDGDVIRTGNTLWVGREAPLALPVEVAQDADHPLVGISPEMELLRADLAVIAPRPISVLIAGETGTSKEVVARTLHRASGRAGRFVA